VESAFIAIISPPSAWSTSDTIVSKGACIIRAKAEPGDFSLRLKAALEQLSHAGSAVRVELTTVGVYTFGIFLYVDHEVTDGFVERVREAVEAARADRQFNESLV